MAEALRTRDIMDARPRFTQHEAIRLNNMFRGRDTLDMLAAVIKDGLAGDVAAVSSFGTESAVLLHLIAQVDPGVPVLFLETGKHFPETIAYRDLLIERLGLTDVRNLTPDAETLAAKDESGLRWSYDPDGCCEIRKVIPLEKAIAGFDATFTGRKGFQSATRAGLPRFEIDGADAIGRLKINPLADWDRSRIDTYFAKHDLPRHPLEAKGYLSIGCAPCTSIVKPGEDPRSGRWRGWDKVECGIHEAVDGDDPANLPSF